jgi:SAM-dependent methyltransferase
VTGDNRMQSFSPEWGGVSYSLRRYFVDRFFARTISTVPEGARVLDIGGHRLRKRGQFDLDEYPVESVCLNLFADRRPHVQGDAHRLPFSSRTFDVVVCGEMLELVRRPDVVVREAFRVLKPGGVLLATIPFMYRIQADPYDFGRYSEHYWRLLLQESGWTDVRIEAHGAFHSVLIDFLKQYLYNRRGRTRFQRLKVGAVIRLQRLALKRDDRAAREKDAFLCAFTTGFGVEAHKPAAPEAALT